jgi:two-component system chemotaxis response regulator CheY
MYKKLRPDVVTMDLTMPNMDGIDTIEKIIEMDADACILVVSALNDKATGMEALEKGAIGFINKPFTPEELCEALNMAIED